MEFLIDIMQWYEKEELQVSRSRCYVWLSLEWIREWKLSTINVEIHRISNEIIHRLLVNSFQFFSRKFHFSPGRILWARRMYKRIQIPYIEFLKRIELKSHPLMKTITEQFLITANGFSIYELLYHRHWYISSSLSIFHDEILVGITLSLMWSRSFVIHYFSDKILFDNCISIMIHWSMLFYENVNYLHDIQSQCQI